MFHLLFNLNNTQANHRKKVIILTLLTFIALC